MSILVLHSFMRYACVGRLLESDHGCYSIDDGKNLNVMEQPGLLKHYVSDVKLRDPQPSTGMP